MKHAKFFEANPNATLDFFGKFTRQELQAMNEPAWKELRRLDNTGDKLAFRAYMRLHEGPRGLINCIMADHDLPNRF
jgi:hypothetical protein